jgi:hypothetical protein
MQALEINLVAYVGAADEYQLSLADYGILAGRAIGARKPVSICAGALPYSGTSIANSCEIQLDANEPASRAE